MSILEPIETAQSWNGIQRRWMYDHSDNRWLHQSIQDVEPIIKANIAAYNMTTKGYRGKSFKHVASIPAIVVEQWLKKGLNPFDENNKHILRRLLNSNEYRHLRTSPDAL